MKIVNILDKNQLIHVNKLLTEIDFEDGEKSASGLAKKAKNNEEAKIDGSSFKEISSYFTNILQNNDWLNRRYLPKQFSQPIINKYLVGSSYGRHFDASHMRIQSLSSKKDFSFTLMLSKASDYEGGELEIETGNMTHKVKLNAGDMVIYPSMYMHNVLPVSKGERIACVGWFASHIKDFYAIETLNAFEDMHLKLLKYDLSEEDQLSLGYVQNRLQHLLSD
jgi:PKHD-type hydroxylase